VQIRIVLALLVAVLPLAHVRAGEDEDQERARSAREAGRALPLAAILDRVRQSAPGVVLGVELEDEGGRVIYEVKVLRPDGRVRRLAYDAATGRPVAHREADGDGD
jgi:YD repeat-containing protein